MKYAAALLVLLASLRAEAGPIQPSHEGCTSSLPVGASWTDTNAPTGFLFMAFYDMEAGCGETIRNPTGGFHSAIVLPDGGYKIEVLAALLPICGRIQFDAHGYNATGLDPLALKSLVYNTGVDCVGGSPSRSGGISVGGGSGGGDNTSGPPSTTIPPGGGVTPPIYTPPGQPPLTPTPIPEPGTLLMMTAGLALLARARMKWRSK